MSADNWGICPKCAIAHVDAKEAAIAAAKKQYGKIPADKYIELIQNAEAMKPNSEPPETLREDYECHTNKKGELYISYGCHCETCGFQHYFKHEADLMTGGTP